MISKYDIINQFYHYTSLESLLKIIDSGCLKFGELPKMNDITESIKDIYIYIENPNIGEDNSIYELIEKRLKRIGQISLCQDGYFPGYAINSMWGYYGNNGEGCCIVLDKEIILKEALKNSYKNDQIIYDGCVSELIVPQGFDIDTYFREEYHKIFYHKSIDWDHEQEYRIINLDFNPKISKGLDIKKAIKSVIFHTNYKHSVFDCPIKQEYINAVKEYGIQTLEYLFSNMWSNDNLGPILQTAERKNILIDETNNFYIDI